MVRDLIQQEEFVSVQTVQAGISRVLAGAEQRGSFIRVIKNSQPIGVLMPNNIFESLTEDVLALSSPNYLLDIYKARKEKKHYSSKDVKQLLGL